jgi:hypothetical protein
VSYSLFNEKKFCGEGTDLLFECSLKNIQLGAEGSVMDRLKTIDGVDGRKLVSKEH